MDNTFEVRGVGSVVSGMVIRGVISVGAQLLMGPTEAATFSNVNVTCIQRCQVHNALATHPQHLNERRPAESGMWQMQPALSGGSRKETCSYRNAACCCHLLDPRALLHLFCSQILWPSAKQKLKAASQVDEGRKAWSPNS